MQTLASPVLSPSDSAPPQAGGLPASDPGPHDVVRRRTRDVDVDAAAPTSSKAATSGLRRAAGGVAGAAGEVTGTAKHAVKTVVTAAGEVVGTAADMAVTSVKGVGKIARQVGNVGQDGLLTTGLNAAKIAVGTAADVVGKGLACCVKHIKDAVGIGVNAAQAGLGVGRNLVDAGVGAGQAALSAGRGATSGLANGLARVAAGLRSRFGFSFGQ